MQNSIIGMIQIKRNKEFFVSANIANKAATIAIHQVLACTEFAFILAILF